MKRFAAMTIVLAAVSLSYAQQPPYDGLTNSLSNLYRTSNAKSFSISPENFTGEKGKGGRATTGVALEAARDLGQTWKVNPYVVVKPDATFTLGEINGYCNITVRCPVCGEPVHP
jgi:hypothetical protein